MSEGKFKMVDENEATALIAHACNEVMAIYPITPSSTMGELADEWASKGTKNTFGTIPHVIEMQSEAGAVHGSPSFSACMTFLISLELRLLAPVLRRGNEKQE